MRPPLRAAKASPGAESATAATAAATVNFFAKSAVNSSHPLFSSSLGDELICKPRARTTGTRERADVVVEKEPDGMLGRRAKGAGMKKADVVGAQASRNKGATFMFGAITTGRADRCMSFAV